MLSSRRYNRNYAFKYSTLDYTMIKDAEDFKQQMENGNVTAGSFSWNDDQQTATPGYMTA